MPGLLQKARAGGNQETMVWVLAGYGGWTAGFSGAGCDAGAEEGGAGGRLLGVGYGEAACREGDPL